MRYLARPWASRYIPDEEPFSPEDCLLGESEALPSDLEHVSLLEGEVRQKKRALIQIPYPKRETAFNPERLGFPVRPRTGHEPATPEEVEGADALKRMNEVLARVQELEDALDDPMDVWGRLRAAWKRAENEEDPKMAEIVRQAREISPVLRDLSVRIRRVLRRHRELTPLDRVQEMDRASMVWLSRQPGRNIPERAGSAQRIMATVRHENFDTLENRVLHAYTVLAADIAREWMREHPSAVASNRYLQVAGFRKVCRNLAASLRELGVMKAPAGVTPNYVLMQDRGYRAVHDAWLRLLLRRRIEDDLWAWQAETWTDFAVLAITLAIDELEEAELVVQSPISWRSEAVTGRWFEQDRPTAVFWLRKTGRIVEVQSRPKAPGSLLLAARAHVALRITDPAKADPPRRIAVWTPHAMRRIDLEHCVGDAASLIEQLQPLAQFEKFSHGLIVAPAHGQAATFTEQRRRAHVQGISIDASGNALAQGFAAVREFVRGDIYRGAE